jgi:uncharacterized protein (TIGR02266 family)
MTKILVVDDVKLFRHLESTILGCRGYIVEEASSGNEALEKVRNQPPDLLLVDLCMPGMSGHEFCHQIKSDPLLQSIPVIIVTSSNSDQDVREAVQAGCDDYLTKPLDDTSLIKKVEGLLGEANQRRFQRIPMSLQVSFEDFKGIFFEYTRDLSRSGIFVEMDPPVPIGTPLRLSFSLPDPFHQPVLAYGTVVRQVRGSAEKPGGVGVRFIHIDEPSRRMIDALVAAQTQLESCHATGMFSRLTYQPQERLEPALSENVQILDAIRERDALRANLEQLQLDHLRLSTILTLIEHLYLEDTPKGVLAVARDALHNLIGASTFGIFLFDPTRSLLVPLESNLPRSVTDAILIQGPIQTAIEKRSLQVPVPPWVLESSGKKVLVVVPIVIGDALLGVITIHDLFPQKCTLNLYDNRLLELLGKHLGLALVNSVARTRAEKTIDTKSILQALS